MTALPEQDSQLRSKLPSDYAKTLHERLDGRFTNTYIRDVINGRRHNMEILEAAVVLAEEEKSKKEALQQRIANL